MVRRSDLLWVESVEAVSFGEGIEREGSSGRGGEVEPGRGSRPDSDEPEFEPGECEDTSETPSDPRLSCLLSGRDNQSGDRRGCLAGAEKSRG